MEEDNRDVVRYLRSCHNNEKWHGYFGALSHMLLFI
jgi:hypothetical protein